MQRHITIIPVNQNPLIARLSHVMAQHTESSKYDSAIRGGNKKKKVTKKKKTVVKKKKTVAKKKTKNS